MTDLSSGDDGSSFKNVLDSNNIGYNEGGITINPTNMPIQQPKTAHEPDSRSTIQSTARHELNSKK